MLPGRHFRAAAELGFPALGDALRADTAATVARLHALGMSTSLITGDNEHAARHFARAAGIDDVHARVLPAEKAAMVRKLQQDARVAMVGDGINDAPAFVQADVGIAFGSGAGTGRARSGSAGPAGGNGPVTLRRAR